MNYGDIHHSLYYQYYKNLVLLLSLSLVYYHYYTIIIITITIIHCTTIIILSLLLPLLLPLLLASVPYYLLNLRGAIKLSEPIYFDKNEWIKLVKQRKQNSLNAEWNNQLL